MRKTIISLALILVLRSICYADIFSKDNTNLYTIDNAVSEDRTGFYYRGGIDYRPQVLPEEPGVGYSILSGSKGCSGFDLASSFNSAFSEQILADYLKGISSSAIAAAPMLLLEYVSPTLADIVKHFNAMTIERIEAFKFFTRIRQKQTAIGHHTIHIESNQTDQFCTA